MSWEQLQAILQENRQTRNTVDITPPVACPIDGSILEIGPRGIRNCPLGNFRWAG